MLWIQNIWLLGWDFDGVYGYWITWKALENQKSPSRNISPLYRTINLFRTIWTLKKQNFTLRSQTWKCFDKFWSVDKTMWFWWIYTQLKYNLFEKDFDRNYDILFSWKTKRTRVWYRVWHMESRDDTLLVLSRRASFW